MGSSVILVAAVLFGVLYMTLRAMEAVPPPKQPRGKKSRTVAPAAKPLPGERWLGWLLAAVYAVFAFAGLGTRTAPESWCVLDYGESAEFSVPPDAVPGSVRFFSGINTGELLLEASPDGVQWETVAAPEQNYVAVLRWNDSQLAGTPGPRFRLTSLGHELDVGELGLYTAAGERISGMTDISGAAALFDEQDTVPESVSYLNGSYFDEIYHVRTAWESLKCDGIYETTHPPLGKLIIALGIALLGVNPFGWRFMGTLFGVLMLPMLYDLLRRLFRRGTVAAACTAVFAFDFMHFTQTRLATIDGFSVFFILGMYYFLFRWACAEEHSRRWLLLSGLFFGLGAATKWVCLYAGAGLALLWLLHWLRKGELFRSRAFWNNVLECLGCFVILPGLIYYASYIPYGLTAGLSGGQLLFSGAYARIVWDNQLSMWSYHSRLVATHPYSSVWWQWVLDVRPILYYLAYEGGKKSAIAAFTGPVLCWGGLGAMTVTAAAAFRRRDGRAWFILLGYLSQMLPWMLVTRLTFAYHYFPSELFLTLALGYALTLIEEKRGNSRVTLGTAAAAVGLFALFYPVLSGVYVSTAYCEKLLRWFPSWPV